MVLLLNYERSGIEQEAAEEKWEPNDDVDCSYSSKKDFFEAGQTESLMALMKVNRRHPLAVRKRNLSELSGDGLIGRVLAFQGS